DLALAQAPPEVRVATTAAMVRSNRRLSRPALRTALNQPQADLRVAAFGALLDLDREQPLSAIRAGRGSSHEDVRARAIDALIPLRQRPRLAARLHASLPNIQQLFNQLATQFGAPLDLPPPGELDDEELEPLFAALACRAPDAAIRGAGALLALGDPRALGAV